MIDTITIITTTRTLPPSILAVLQVCHEQRNRHSSLLHLIIYIYELLLQFHRRAAGMEPEVMGPDQASWSAFDPAMPVDESEVMAQLFGSRGFSGSQDQQMLWPDHNGNAYDLSHGHDLNYYPYQWPPQGNCSTCKDDAPAANYEGDNYLSYPHEVPAVVGVCSGPMNFSIGGVQIDTPSVPAGAYSAVCLNEARRDDDETGSCKRKGRAVSMSELFTGRSVASKLFDKLCVFFRCLKREAMHEPRRRRRAKTLAMTRREMETTRILKAPAATARRRMVLRS